LVVAAAEGLALLFIAVLVAGVIGLGWGAALRLRQAARP
jgi:hypothetical protein